MTIGLSALLRHELLILRNGARGAFARKRDWVPLAIGAPVLLAGLVQGLNGLAADPPTALRLVTAFVALVGFAAQTAILRRLDHLGRDSVMARAALQPRVALAYASICHLPLAAIGSAAAAFVTASGWRPACAAVALAIYCGGAGVATIVYRLSKSLLARRWSFGTGMCRARRTGKAATQQWRMGELLVRRVAVGRLSIAGNALAFLALGVGIALLYLVLGGLAPTRVAEVVSGAFLLVALAVLARQHPPLWRYVSAMGMRPAALALLPALPALALLGGFVAAAAAGGAPPGPLAAGAATVLLLFGLVGVLRALHYAAKPRMLADLSFQVDLIAIALAGFLSFLLAPIVVLVRLWQLRRTAERSRWLLP